MQGCGHCNKAKKDLENEILSGQVVIKSSADAPPGTRGFPFFMSTNGKQATGFSTKEKLFEQLGETLQPNKPHHPQPHQPHHPQPHHPQPHQPHHPQPHHPHHPQPHHPQQEPEICSKRSGGYVTLSETWKKQQSYIA